MSKEADCQVELMFEHWKLVEAGLIPEDSPSNLVLPAKAEGT